MFLHQPSPFDGRLKLAKLLQTYLDGLPSKIEALRSLKKRGALVTELRSLHAEAKNVADDLQANYKRQFVKPRKAIIAISNYFEGLSNGVEDKTISRPEFLSSLVSLSTEFLAKASSTYEDELAMTEKTNSAIEASDMSPEEKKKVQELVSKSADLKSALEEIKIALNTVKAKIADDTTTSEVTKIFKAAEGKRSALPLRLEGAFQVLRLPIIPIFKSVAINNSETFKSLGIRHVDIEGYALLEDQLILCVDKKLALKNGISVLVLAQHALDLINDKGETQFSMVTEQPTSNVRNTNIQCFWIMPSRKVTALIKKAGNKAMDTKWGFPFQ